MILHLDVVTMIFMLGIIYIFLAVVFYLSSISSNTINGVKWWANGGLLLAGGFFLLCFRWYYPGSHLLIFTHNILTVAGLFSLYIGSRRFFNLPVNLHRLVRFYLIYLLLIFLFLYVIDSINVRIILYSMLLFLLLLFTAKVYFDQKTVIYKSSVKLIGFSFVLGSLMGLFRATYSIIYPQSNFFENTNFQSVMYTLSLLLGLIWTIGFVKIINQRLNFDLIQTSEKLKEAIEDKDRMISIISHDLRGSLGSIAGLAGLIYDDTMSLTEREKRDLTFSIHKSTLTVLSLLTNLLDWSKIRQGTITYNPELKHLTDLLEEPLSYIKDLLKQKNIQFETDIPHDTLIFADVFMIQTVIRNLLVNAIKFTPKGGSISLQLTKTTKTELTISVTDTGIGIPPEMLPTLFNYDKNNNRIGTSNEPTTGFGLFLCRELIEKSGGTIQVISSPGKGSTFSFTLVNQPA